METINNTETLEVAPEIVEGLLNAFRLMNPVEFAKYVHPLPIAQTLKSEFLAAKVAQTPEDADNAMSVAVERSMRVFWQRLADQSVGLVMG